MQEESKSAEDRYQKLLNSVRNKAGFEEHLSKMPPKIRERFEKEMAEFLKLIAKKTPTI